MYPAGRSNSRGISAANDDLDVLPSLIPITNQNKAAFYYPDQSSFPRTYGSFPRGDPISPIKATFQDLRQASIDSGHSLHSQAEIESQHLELSQGAKKANIRWLEEEVVEKRCRDLGLKERGVDTFINRCEFVSLGCFCGSTRAIQCLGLKRFSYPFDWVRCDVKGIMHCLEFDFEDFCTSSYVGESPNEGVVCHGDSVWGGSFWHHDPHDDKVRDDFERRIERLQGNLEVSPSTTRVFCIALNALRDAAYIQTLRYRLQRMLPSAEIYLLVFLDNQPATGPVHVSTDDYQTLFYWVYEDMFKDNGRTWSEEKQSEEYAKGLATAIRFWAGVDDLNDMAEVATYQDLFSSCNNFNGGDPARKLYWPTKQPQEKPPPIRTYAAKAGFGGSCGLSWPWNIFVQPCDHNYDDEEENDLIYVHRSTDAIGF